LFAEVVTNAGDPASPSDGVTATPDAGAANLQPDPAGAPAVQEVVPDQSEAVVPDKQPDFGYQVVQLIVGKKFPRLLLGKTLKIYGAVLYNLNHSARQFDAEISTQVVDDEGVVETVISKTPIGPFRNDRFAWYAGFQFGEVCKCGDWAFKAVYEYVQPF